MHSDAAALALPVKTREILNFALDSRRWNGFEFRDDDIVIGTWSKSGTTLTQQVVAQLVFIGDTAADMKTAVGAGLAIWVTGVLLPNAGFMGVNGLFTTNLTVLTTIGGLFECVAAALAGAAVYKESAESARSMAARA